MTWLRSRRDGAIDHVHALRHEGSLGSPFHAEITTIANTAMVTYAPSLIFIRPLLPLLEPLPGWRLDHSARSASDEACGTLVPHCRGDRRRTRRARRTHGQNGQRAVD